VASLTLLSWNVLANAYAKPHRFPRSDPSWLRSLERQAAVAKLALSFDADVIALQQADEDLVNYLAHLLSRKWRVNWCPAANNQPDGCLTLVRRPWRVAKEERLVYDDYGLPLTGRVAHILQLRRSGGCSITIANTHLAWAPPGTTPGWHTGLEQMDELATALGYHGPLVIAADINDPPGGPVRDALGSYGYAIAEPSGFTSLVDGDEGRKLDVVAGRYVQVTCRDTGITAKPPMPGPLCPSNHVPLLANLVW
jgi:mRNA deadenylase 3'-5' endonuclease subunit Ccr4